MRGFSKEYKWSTNLVAWGHQRESQHFKAHLHHIDSGTKYPPCLLLIGWKHFFHGPFGPHQPTTTPAASLHVSLMYDFFSVFKFLYDINYSHNLISKFYTKVLHLIQRHRTLFLWFFSKVMFGFRSYFFSINHWQMMNPAEAMRNEKPSDDFSQTVLFLCFL